MMKSPKTVVFRTFLLAFFTKNDKIVLYLTKEMGAAYV